MCRSSLLAKLPTKSAAFIESFSKGWSHCPESSASVSAGRYLGVMLDLSDSVGSSGSQRARVKMPKKVRELASARSLPVSLVLSESRYWRDGVSTKRIVTVQR